MAIISEENSEEQMEAVKRYENRKPSIWQRFKAGAKDIADKTLKAPKRQSQKEMMVEQNGNQVPISQYEREIYETERKKVLIEEARKRAIANAHRPPQPKQEGFWKRMVSETPEQKRKAQEYLQGKSILQHMVNPSQNRQFPQYVDIDKIARSGMAMTGLGSGKKPTKPQSIADMDRMLRQQMGLGKTHPIIHAKKGKYSKINIKRTDAVSQINKLMGL